MRDQVFPLRTIILALLVFDCALSAAHAAQPLHKLLFANVSGIPETDERAIARLTGWRVSADGKGVADQNCGPIPVEARVLELAAGVAPGVLFVWGNGCTSGHAGSSVSLYVKGPKGYTMQMGFPGFDVVPLANRRQGYVDLRVEGPGECQPVWGWTGKAYDFVCSVESRRGACRQAGGNAAKLCQR